MNERELEQLLRNTSVSNNSEDVQLRILSRLAELDTSRGSRSGIWGWKGAAVAGWVTAGIAFSFYFLPISNREFDRVVNSRGATVVPDEYATDPEFENDADEPIRALKHPWSSRVILLTNLSSDHRQALPTRGRFRADIEMP